MELFISCLPEPSRPTDLPLAERAPCSADLRCTGFEVSHFSEAFHLLGGARRVQTTGRRSPRPPGFLLRLLSLVGTNSTPDTVSFPVTEAGKDPHLPSFQRAPNTPEAGEQPSRSLQAPRGHPPPPTQLAQARKCLLASCLGSPPARWLPAPE